jgi:adenine-specific DNA-methyltransferase
MRKDPVSTDHEYVLGYAAHPGNANLSGLLVTEDQYPFIEKDGRRYASTDLTIGATSEDRPNQFYAIKNPKSGVVYEANPNRVWRFEPDAMKKVIANGLVIWPDEARGDLKRPRYKTYFDPENPKIKAVSSWIVGLRAEPDSDAEDFDEDIAEISSGFTAEGGKLLRRIFGKKVFNYPKPVSLLKSLLKVATKENDFVLDSFAGSGTTAHAVLELNKENGGKRKFILVQQPFDTKENAVQKLNICEQVTAERVRRVIYGYSFKTQTGKTEKVAGMGGTFTFARVGPMLFNEYRDLGSRLPTFEEIARYIFFTETSQNFDPKQVDAKTGRIGEWKGTSYYLLYTPNRKEDRALDKVFIADVLAKDKSSRKVVYCEKVWVHREDLAELRPQAGEVRPMLVPFNLK